jgi:hypothetical protein
LTATYVGFVNGDTPASLSHPATLSTTATAQSPAGPYPINVTDAASSDYTITQTPGKMTVLSDVGKAVMIPDPLNPAQNLLSVRGTSASEVIVINRATTAGYVTVIYRGKSLGTFGPIGRIRIHGGGGNDVIRASQSVVVPVWLYADSGNAQLSGGGGPTLLMGGSGRDALWGGNGRTIMVGGKGASRLFAGRGDAILIGGTTTYDANDLALQALLSTWSSSASYATRVSQLASDPTNPLNANTVFNDKVADFLFGGSGMDLYFRSPRDFLTRPRRGETVITTT